jgi:hypothetical protein
MSDENDPARLAARLSEAADELCNQITRLERRDLPKPPPLPATAEELRRRLDADDCDEAGA